MNNNEICFVIPLNVPAKPAFWVFYFLFTIECGHSTFQENKKSDEKSSDFEDLRSGRDSNPTYIVLNFSIL